MRDGERDVEEGGFKEGGRGGGENWRKKSRVFMMGKESMQN